MARNLPAGWQEAAILSHRIEAVVHLYYGPEGAGDVLRLTTASGGLKLDGNEYMGVLLDIPRVRLGADRKTHEPEIGKVEIRVSNRQWEQITGQKFSDFLEDTSLGSGVDIGFENRKIEIRQWTKGVTAWADCARMPSCRFREPSEDQEEVVIICQDDSELHFDLDLPRTIITATGYPEAPAESIGKRIPITVGAVDRAPGVLVDNVGALQKVLFDDDTYAQDGFHSYISSPRPLYIHNDDGFYAVEQYINPSYLYSGTQLAECSIAGWAGDDCFFPDVKIQGAEQDATNWGGANPENANDEDTATYSGINFSTVRKDWIIISLNMPGKLGGQPAYQYSFCKVRLINTVGYGTEIRAESADGAYSTVLRSIGAQGQDLTFNNIDGSDGLLDKKIGNPSRKLSDVLFVAENISAATTDVRFYEIGLYLLFACEFTEWTFYVDVKGRKDDGSGTYTGTAGALIENPADIIHHIAANDLGITNIDTASFQAARTVRSGWKFAFSVTQKIKGLDLLVAIGREAGLYIGFDNENKLRCVPIKTTYSDTDVTKTINYSELIDPKFKRTGTDEVISRVELRYKKNYATGIYEGLATASHTDTETRYNVATEEATLFLESDYIRDAATAASVAALRLKHNRNPHNLLPTGMSALDHAELEFGDIVKLADVPKDKWPRGKDPTINQTVNGQTIYPYWIILMAEDEGNVKDIEAEQLHDLS